MKKLVLFILILILLNVAYSQDADKTVTLTATGQGKTIDEARTNALRSAIEQAFGAFISSNTTIIDDTLVKDEIVSITNGNIQKYDVLNETILQDGTYATTLNAIVSVSKLTSFCESKGINAEFKGGLFAMNMAIQELNEKNERIAWTNSFKIISKLLQQSFDYNIKADEPSIGLNKLYAIPLTINIDFNKNFELILNQLNSYAKSVSLSEIEVSQYNKLNKPTFPIKFDNPNDNNTYYLRNREIYDSILSIPWILLKYCICNTQINNDIENYDFFKMIKSNDSKIEIIDKNLWTGYVKGERPFDNDNMESYPLFYLIRSGYLERKEKMIMQRNLYDSNYVEIYPPLEKNQKKINNNWYFDNFGYKHFDPNGYLEFEFNGKTKVYPFLLKLFEKKEFIQITLNETRPIEEIKKINGYKVYIKKEN